MSDHEGRSNGGDGNFLLDVLRCDASPESPAPAADDGTASSSSDTSQIPGLSLSGYELSNNDTANGRELVEVPDQYQGKNSALDNFLLDTLDEVERRTEKLRQTVKDADEERSQLLKSLDTVMRSEALGRVSEADRQELEVYIDRLLQRLLTIDISVQIVRSPPQEQSLKTVHTFLVKLRDSIRDGNADGETMINRYLNSCMEEANGPVDDRFQGALLGCAFEDQKGIRKKLGAISKARENTEAQMAIFASMDLV